MARCPSCDYPLPDDRERVGARCPHCRQPIYEPPTRIARTAREGESSCPVHAGMETVGVCGRCGNYLCEACRTRWRGVIVCAACVDRALGTREAAPEQQRAHFRQAVLGLVLGLAAWVLSTLAILGVGLLASGGEVAIGLVLLMMLVLAFDVLLACLGVGQAAAALRVRGNHMILATLGLVLGGLYVGAMLGLGTFSLWQN
jgi:hypothetical protein